ncbi:MAG TPA: hypothetical protein DCR55_10745 [Lentisphaeria bacterium]|nr:hypothetical protein [Lentisphaeria bacterium]
MKAEAISAKDRVLQVIFGSMLLGLLLAFGIVCTALLLPSIHRLSAGSALWRSFHVVVAAALGFFVSLILAGFLAFIIVSGRTVGYDREPTTGLRLTGGGYLSYEIPGE